MASQRVAVRPVVAGRQIIQRRFGLTLVEMLVATVATMFLMMAVVRVFAMFGESVAAGRATITMSSQLRAVSHRLQTDLDGITAPTLPWIKPESGLGYFEYLEGREHDYTHSLPDEDEQHVDTNLLEFFEQLRGDADDILMFTSRSEGKPFRGRRSTSVNLSTVIESSVAEIIWWVQKDGLNNINLYRRVLLIRPDLNTAADGTTGIPIDPNFNFTDFNDISVRPSPDGTRYIANSLADLSKRENRYSHFPLANQFPYATNLASNSPLVGSPASELAEYVALSHVLAFDVRAFDPQAKLVYSSTDNSLVLSPSDPGYPVNLNQIAGQGAYVDLNFGRHPSFQNSIPPNSPFASSFSHINPQSALALNLPPSLIGVWDTWPSHYERDGLDQDGDGLIDEGTDGLDNNSVGGVDDPSERETAPPFPFPLRGIKVTLRVFEGDSRQIRQVSVIGDFVPE